MTKILLVDDQPTLVALMSEFLSSEGYEVTTHTDGLTALQQMIALRPDLVITDLSMPGMDGAALLTAMRDNAYLHETPVLVLSGRPEHEILEACAGRAMLMRKPARPDDVLKAVRGLIHGERQPQSRPRSGPFSGSLSRIGAAPLARAA
ncbi:MAG TPA: alkaline phosphatase [Achromobacter sp.]|uniref:response regulator n=1 Tax=Achromobacter sp. TaxID=134375 RepID=UPI000EEB56D4|nr:response regulator [Achromobacter sp.]HAP27661.1 alkaline phosphatase [Achromobacter sp.]